MGASRRFLGAYGLWLVAGCGSQTEPERYVGGAVTGLHGDLILASTDGQTLSLSQDGAFVLPGALAAGQSYNVFIMSAPETQSCIVSQNTGVIGDHDIDDVKVTCSLAFGYYTVGGTVTGLAPSGAQGGLALTQGQEQLNIADNGAFVFNVPLKDHSAYAVGVATLPVGQNCQIAQAQGYIAAAHAQDVAIVCAPSQAMTLTVLVSGLVQDASAVTDVLSVADAAAAPAAALTFTSQTPKAQSFQKAYTYGAPYALRLVPPSGMRCAWDKGGKPADALAIAGVVVGNTTLGVTCTPAVTYALSVSVQGISAGTLWAANRQSVDLANPLAFDLAQTTAQPFGYAYAPGQSYAIDVVAPFGHTCAPTAQSPNLTGVMSADTQISLACSKSPARLSVGVTGVTRGQVAVGNGIAQDGNSPLVFTALNGNDVQRFAHTYTAADTYTLSLSAQALACYFVENGATQLTRTLMGDVFVAIRCAETIP